MSIDFSQVFEPLAAHGPLVYFCYCPADGQVLYVSSSYEPVLGGHVAAVNDELPGWLAALHPDDRTYLAECLAHVATGGQVQDVLLRLARPGGGTRWLSMTAARYQPVADAPLLLSGYVQDVTLAQEILENANRYQAKKNSMLEILSHDLAGPLVLAEQMTDYLAERVAVLADPQLNKMLESMRRSCQEGVTLIRDFVDQEFLESANIDLKLTRLDLAAHLRDILDNYQQRQHAAGHYFYFEASHPSIYADIDDNKFLQVINNLLGNALKFTPDGGHLRVQLSQHPRHLLVTVADDGIGIPAAMQARLFERFTQARRPGLRGEKTTGLGMSIIKTIVELHQGRIWLESAEGRGTTFYIELPLPRLDRAL
ncbi:MAG: PAS domain-containing sensor histidine kinase [Janthinobacterium lividum]